MNLKELSREFHSREHIYKHLQGEALFILEQSLERTDIKYHSITSRVKKINSFLDKAQRKELKKAGYKTIGEVDNIIDNTEMAFRLYEEERPPSGADSGKKFLDIGVVRVSAEIADDNFIRVSTARQQLAGDFEEHVQRSIQGYTKHRKLLKDRKLE